eukprot:gene47517-919_t
MLWMVLSLGLEIKRDGKLGAYYSKDSLTLDLFFNEPVKVLLLAQWGPVMKTIMKVWAGKLVTFALQEAGLMDLWRELLRGVG